LGEVSAEAGGESLKTWELEKAVRPAAKPGTVTKADCPIRRASASIIQSLAPPRFESDRTFNSMATCDYNEEHGNRVGSPAVARRPQIKKKESPNLLPGLASPAG